MGDARELLEENWIPHDVPQALPEGKPHIHPADAPHAVSSSLPTWDAVVAWSRKDKAAKVKVAYSYPRFHIAWPLQNLALQIRERFQIKDDTSSCLVYSSSWIADYCAARLKALNQDAVLQIHTARFFLPNGSGADGGMNRRTEFSVVLFPIDLTKQAMLDWMDTGAGITTRHAKFCTINLDFLASDSQNPSFQTPAPFQSDHHVRPDDEWHQSALDDLQDVQARIAQLVTSESTKLKRVRAEDVFVFPTGMNAIFSASEALAALNKQSDVVAYGWLYPETVRVLRRPAWRRAISFKWGIDEELDELERMLTNSDYRITALFCELPSNVKLISPNLERIRSLADKHNFIVACDETAGNFINIDVLPYVDVLVSSLTKMFSGASNVTGGSVVLNPNSRHYETVRSQLAIQYKSVYCFPADIAVLKQNSVNMASRVRKANANAMDVVAFLQHHPLIEQVLHPSIGPTHSLYRKHMRQDGGYGNVLSVVFRNPYTARRFYDHVDLCKGSSFGTNFTLVVPYVQLACYMKQDKCAAYGLPPHIIRMSVGLEDPLQIVGKIRAALDIAHEAEEGQV